MSEKHYIVDIIHRVILYDSDINLTKVYTYLKSNLIFINIYWSITDLDKFKTYQSIDPASFLIKYTSLELRNKVSKISAGDITDLSITEIGNLTPVTKKKFRMMFLNNYISEIISKDLAEYSTISKWEELVDFIDNKYCIFSIFKKI